MQTIPLEELIKKAIRSEVARIHTQVPGRVISYDRSTQTVKVQLVISHSFENEDGEREYYKPPPLVNVPVKFPAILTWPISEGDPGWVEFAERSTDEYRATGRDSEPKDARRFDLSDAIFFPTYLRGEADTADGAAVLAVEEIRIGDSSVSTFLARADRVEARLKAIEKYLREHEHTYTVPAIPASPAPTILPRVIIPNQVEPGVPNTLDDATASDKVKGE